MHKSTNLSLIDRGHNSKKGKHHNDFLLRSMGHGWFESVEPIQNLANLKINQPTREPVLKEFVSESLQVIMKDLVVTGDFIEFTSITWVCLF